MEAQNSITKDYFYFTGQSATCGDAHPQTGKRSIFGKTYRFQTKALAEKFAEEDRRYETVQKVGNVRTMRQFNLGQSVDAFHESLAILEYES